MDQHFIQTCLNDTLQGLRQGLSHFSGPSTAAVIYNLPGQDELHIYDPHSLLRDHELKIHSFYFDTRGRQMLQEYTGKSNCYSSISPVADFQIDGLLSYGGSSVTVPYQMWFTEHHPDLISTGPTEKWLAHTVLRLSHDIANKADLYTGISGSFLREYATHAIHDHIHGETLKLTGKTSTIDISQILDAILGILKTREEGERPMGELVFVPPEEIDEISFMARFVEAELPQLHHYKHVRKLLQTVANTPHWLVSDGATIRGIATTGRPSCMVKALYHGRYGYLSLNDDPICSFADGRYSSSSLRAKLFEVEESLLDYELDTETRNSLFHIIATLVHNAQSMKHGCTFVVDLNQEPVRISGQLLQTPLDLNNAEYLELACGFSRVDGALHICRDQRLHSFACLLDGHTIAGEDRARGARYNSALRFTAENPDTIVIVVSRDRPVSVIQRGMVLHEQCHWHSLTNCSLPSEPLKQWLA